MNLTDPATATVGSNTTITADLGTILVQSQTDAGASSSATTTGVAAGIQATADATTTATSAAQTNVCSGAQLVADIVSLLSGDLSMGRSASSYAYTIADDFADTITSTSTTTSNFSAAVNVAAGTGSGADPNTVIDGTESVTIETSNGPATSSAISNAQSNGLLPIGPALGGDTTSNANNTPTTTSEINVASTANTDIKTGSLTVQANLATPTLTTTSKRGAALIDTGAPDPNQATPVELSIITFNADVTILGTPLELLIDASGQEVVLPSSGISYTIQNSQIVVGADHQPVHREGHAHDLRRGPAALRQPRLQFRVVGLRSDHHQ